MIRALRIVGRYPKPIYHYRREFSRNDADTFNHASDLVGKTEQVKVYLTRKSILYSGYVNKGVLALTSNQNGMGYAYQISKMHKLLVETLHDRFRGFNLKTLCNCGEGISLVWHRSIALLNRCFENVKKLKFGNNFNRALDLSKLVKEMKFHLTGRNLSPEKHVTLIVGDAFAIQSSRVIEECSDISAVCLHRDVNVKEATINPEECHSNESKFANLNVYYVSFNGNYEI